MTWADVTKQHRLPLDQQAKPDPNLLEHSDSADDDSVSQSQSENDKVHVVSREEFEHEKAGIEHADEMEASGETGPHVLLSEKDAPAALPKPAASTSGSTKPAEPTKPSTSSSSKATPSKKDLDKDVKVAKEEVLEELEHSDKVLADKASAASQKASSTANKAANEASSAAKKAGASLDKAAEEAKEQYNSLSEKAKEEYDVLSDKAKAAYNRLSKEGREDWHKLSKEGKKRWQEARDSDIGREVQKPEVWGSMLTVANLAVLGTVGYYAYANWHKPRWDRRFVTATVVGVATWFGVQGYAELFAISQVEETMSKKGNR